MGTDKETTDRIALSPEIAGLLDSLREKVITLARANADGDIIANKTLEEIGERTKRLSALTLQERDNGSPAVERMQRLLQEIVFAQPNNQGETIQLTDEQAIAIGKYVDNVSQEPSGNRIANDTYEKRELKLDLGDKRTIGIIVHLNNSTVLAWELNRQKNRRRKTRTRKMAGQTF